MISDSASAHVCLYMPWSSDWLMNQRSMSGLCICHVHCLAKQLSSPALAPFFSCQISNFENMKHHETGTKKCRATKNSISHPLEYLSCIFLYSINPIGSNAWIQDSYAYLGAVLPPWPPSGALPWRDWKHWRASLVHPSHLNKARWAEMGRLRWKDPNRSKYCILMYIASGCTYMYYMHNAYFIYIACMILYHDECIMMYYVQNSVCMCAHACTGVLI